MIPILLCRYFLFFYSFFVSSRSLSYMFVTSATAFVLMAFVYFIVDVKHWWGGGPFFYAGTKKHPRVLVNISIYYPLADSSFLSLCFKAWIQLCCTLATAWLGGCFPSITSVDQCGPTGPSCLKRSGERASGFLLGTSCTKMKYSSVCK